MILSSRKFRTRVTPTEISTAVQWTTTCFRDWIAFVTVTASRPALTPSKYPNQISWCSRRTYERAVTAANRRIAPVVPVEANRPSVEGEGT